VQAPATTRDPQLMHVIEPITGSSHLTWCCPPPTPNSSEQRAEELVPGPVGPLTRYPWDKTPPAGRTGPKRAHQIEPVPYRTYHAGTFLALTLMLVSGGLKEQPSNPDGPSKAVYRGGRSPPRVVSMPDRDYAAEVEAMLEEINTMCDQVAAAVRDTPDLDLAFRLADDLSKTVAQLAVVSASLRTEAAGRIWDSKRMTLSALADRIGVGTTRAHQLIKGVRKGKEPEK
jgi:hypothetical protein